MSHLAALGMPSIYRPWSRKDGDNMRERSEEWKKLCEEAAVEQDPRRLLELTRRINELLLGKQKRLDSAAPPAKDNDSPA